MMAVCCVHCRRPMADGGAPLPGEGKVPVARACASCWRLFHAIADEKSLIVARSTVNLVQSPDLRAAWKGESCHHGVSYDDPCAACDNEILGFDVELAEVID